MKDKTQIVDTFQVIGFVISIAISLSLIVIGQDTIPSVTLGLVVATFTQIFDLQLRYNTSEERLLKAGLLNELLYKDEWLLRQVQQIVTSYLRTKEEGFELFKIRANDAIIECHSVLHGMANGYLVALPRSPYSYGAKGLNSAKKSAKAVAIADFSYWRSTYAQPYLQANKNAIERGVKITRVFIADKKTLEDISDIAQVQKDMGIEVYAATLGEIPSRFVEDTLIIDERVFARGELTSDGKIREQRLTIDPVEVQQAVIRFGELVRQAEKL
jgi:hypothetical protein